MAEQICGMADDGYWRAKIDVHHKNPCIVIIPKPKKTGKTENIALWRV
jgi:hypothetical protein